MRCENWVDAKSCVQGAALKLAYMEYADLQLEERLALLQALLEQALDCELVRDLITSKVEAMALPRQKKPVCYACCAACNLLLLLLIWCNNWRHCSHKVTNVLHADDHQISPLSRHATALIYLIFICSYAVCIRVSCVSFVH